jgi:hypothetical protein
MSWLLPIIIAIYYGIGYRLTFIAFRYLRPGRPNSFLAIYDPSNFEPEGERARQRAMHFWWVGVVVVAAVLIGTVVDE